MKKKRKHALYGPIFAKINILCEPKIAKYTHYWLNLYLLLRLGWQTSLHSTSQWPNPLLPTSDYESWWALKCSLEMSAPHWQWLKGHTFSDDKYGGMTIKAANVNWGGGDNFSGLELFGTKEGGWIFHVLKRGVGFSHVWRDLFRFFWVTDHIFLTPPSQTSIKQPLPKRFWSSLTDNTFPVQPSILFYTFCHNSDIIKDGKKRGESSWKNKE